MRLFKQQRIPWLGALIDAIYTTTPMISMIQFASIITILYTNVDKWLPKWVTLIWFIALFASGSFILVGLVYIFVLRSVWGFRAKQMFGQDALNAIEEVVRKTVKEELEKKGG